MSPEPILARNSSGTGEHVCSGEGVRAEAVGREWGFSVCLGNLVVFPSSRCLVLGHLTMQSWG